MKRGIVVMASLTLATTAFTSAALAQDPSASPAPAGSPAAGGGPALFDSDYPERFKEGKAGGTLIVADWQEANLFNPYYTNNVTEADIATATNGGLITSTDDFKYAPDFAKSIPTVDNGGVVLGQNGDAMTVTWELRDVKWSDGTPITCDDYSFTLDWYTDDANTGIPAGQSGYLTDDYLARAAAAAEAGEASPPKTDADRNLTVECVSPTQMVWHLKNIYSAYLTLLPYVFQRAYNSQFAVADMVTGGAGWGIDAVVNAPVGGPYKFGAVTPGQQVDLVRNDQYVDAITGGPAYLDKVIVKWYADADAMIAAYQGDSPEYDVAKDLNDADIPKLEGLKKVVQLPSLTYEFLRPNWDADHCSLTLQTVRNGACPASDPAVREALKYALDKDAINARLLGGNAAIAYTNVSPSAWFYVAPAETPTQDLERASQILTDAGYILDPTTGNTLFKDVDGDGAKDYSKGDYDLRLEACTTTRQVRQDTLAMVSGFMNAIGVTVLISPVSSSDIFASYNESTEQTPCALSRGNFDIAEHAFSVPLDPLTNFPVYHSTQFTPNGQNDAHVNDPDIDTALETVKSTVDFGEIQSAMATFQQVYQDKTVEVPLYYRKEVYLVNPKLVNFTGNPTSTGPFWNIQHWFLKGKAK
jgi:ABC-type transport system substrate-binding protein